MLSKLRDKVSAAIEGLAYFFKSKLILQSVSMKNKSQTEVGLWIGIDWADQKHDAYVIDSNGQGQHETFEQSVRGIETWLARKMEQSQGKPIAIIIEKSSNGIFHALMMQQNVILYPINPKQFARYRESYQNAGTKDDKNDARLLARMLRERQSVLQPFALDDESTRLLDQLCRNRRKLVDQRAKCRVRLKSQLKASFPLMLELKVSFNAMVALLKRWPDPRQAKRANPATLSKVLRAAAIGNEPQVESLIKQNRESKLLTSDAAIHSAMAIAFRAQCQVWLEYGKAIEQFDEAIKSAMKTHEDSKLFASLPGAGAALAPRVLTAFGSNRSKYDDAEEIAALSGIAPVTKQSGMCQRH